MTQGPSGSAARGTAARAFGDWLGLAATPTFAVMALATGLLGGAPANPLCSLTHGSVLGGMVPMYVLMSALHSPPWLKLILGRRPSPCEQASA